MQDISAGREVPLFSMAFDSMLKACGSWVKRLPAAAVDKVCQVFNCGLAFVHSLHLWPGFHLEYAPGPHPTSTVRFQPPIHESWPASSDSS